MGSSVIHAAAPPPSLPTQPLGLVAALPPMPDEKKNEKVDYFRLPCPVPYEEINREVSTLKPDCFEGFRFDFVKSLNQNFALSHGVSMGLMQDFPPRSANITKVPFANYEFGANYFDPKLMLVGRIMTDGRLNARFKCDLTDNLIMKGIAQITDEPHGSQGTCQFDYKGRDYRTQFQTGNPGLYTANYIQSVAPNLSLGAEVFWLAQQRRSGIGFSARYNTDKMVATAQVAGGGVLQLGYAQKVNEKVTLASDFMYNSFTGDVTASIGYDYILKQCRLRGKIDSSGVISALLEEQLSMGIGFLLSAEIDHSKKDYKFGFGLAFGGV